MKSSSSVALCVIVGILLVQGCSSTAENAQGVCSVTPPSNLEGDKALAAKAAVDLTAFASLPVSAEGSVETKEIFKATFQKVPDAAAACAMLNQTYVCIKDKDRAAQYLSFMKETEQCRAQ